MSSFLFDPHGGEESSGRDDSHLKGFVTDAARSEGRERRRAGRRNLATAY